jgi:hypothetical protein
VLVKAVVDFVHLEVTVQRERKGGRFYELDNKYLIYGCTRRVSRGWHVMVKRTGSSIAKNTQPARISWCFYDRWQDALK